MEAKIPLCPYVGLQPFSEADREYFFGREQDQETIAANLLTSKLTILYGESGVGKSSVLQAGVLPILHSIPNLTSVTFRTWQDATFAETLRLTIQRELKLPMPEATESDLEIPLDEFLVGALRQTGGALALILDQFEEYFLYHSNRETAFDAALARAINNLDLRVNFLIALREDSLAKLDRFEGRIPHLYSNYLRLDYLGREGAEQAIKKPLEVFNAARPGQPPVTIEQGLVDELLRVQSGKAAPTRAAEKKAIAGPVEPSGILHIEASFLQMVLTRLWFQETGLDPAQEQYVLASSPRAAIPLGKNTLRLATFNQLGGAQKIVSSHLDGLMGKLSPQAQSACAQMFDHLVTPSRTKIAQTTTDLATYVNAPEETILPILKRLEDGRVLRRVAAPTQQANTVRYEIFHDVLASSLLDWRRRYLERERFRRITFLAIGASALVLLFALLTLWAYFASRSARASELQANAIVNLEIDPERSILLALESLKLENSTAGEAALRRALAASLTLLTFRDHRQALYGVAASPDGTQVLSTDVEGRVFLWDPNTGQVLHELKGHTDLVWSGSFSPDSKTVVTAGEDGVAIVWDVATGSPIASLKKHNGVVAWASYSPDGRRIASAGQDHTVVVWDAKTYSPLATCRGPASDITHVVFNADSTALVASSKDGTVWVWDLNCQTKIQEFVYPDSGTAERIFWSAEFSPDKKRVLTAGADGKVRIWNIETGKQERIIQHNTIVSSAVYSADGTQILTASWDSTAKVWDADTGRQLNVLAGHTDAVHSAVFLPDGHRIVTGSFDKSARIWDLASGGERPALRSHRGRVWTAYTSPDDKRIVSAGSDGIIQWDLASGSPISAIHSMSATVGSAVYSLDGSRILASSSDKTARVFDAQDGRELLRLDHPAGVVIALYSPDGKYIATTSYDSFVRLWDAQSGQLLRTYQGHTDKAYGLVWSRDSKLFATSGYDSKAMVWDINQTTPLVTVQDTVSERAIATDKKCCIIFGVALSPDGKSLATAGDSHLVRIWDVKTGALKMDLRGHTDRLFSVFYSHDGAQIISAGVDGTARIWDARTGALRHILRGHTDFVTNAAFSNDDRYVITSSADKTVRIFTMDGQELIKLANTRVTRALTCEERAEYLHEGKCPNPTPLPDQTK